LIRQITGSKSVLKINLLVEGSNEVDSIGAERGTMERATSGVPPQSPALFSLSFDQYFAMVLVCLQLAGLPPKI